MVTAASVHDSHATDVLLCSTKRSRGNPFYADSAYTGEPQEKGMKNQNGYRNKPLTEKQKVNNTAK
jgi:hypothetical protein